MSSETPKNGFLSSPWDMFFDEKIGGRIFGKHFFNIIHIQNDQTNRLDFISWSYDTSISLKVRKMIKNVIFRKSYSNQDFQKVIILSSKSQKKIKKKQN